MFSWLDRIIARMFIKAVFLRQNSAWWKIAFKCIPRIMKSRNTMAQNHRITNAAYIVSGLHKNLFLCVTSETGNVSSISIFSLVQIL